MTYLFFITSFVCLLHWTFLAAATTTIKSSLATFTLSYDGIVSSDLMALYVKDASGYEDKEMVMLATEDISTKISIDIIQMYVKVLNGSRMIDIDSRCYYYHHHYHGQQSGISSKCGRCSIDHYQQSNNFEYNDDVSVHITTQLYFGNDYEDDMDNSKYLQSSQNSTSDLGESARAALIRIDVSIDGDMDLIRDVLVRSIPKITKTIDMKYTPTKEPIWSIQHRLNAFELQEKRKSKISSFASVEELVLSNSNLINRMRVTSSPNMPVAEIDSRTSRSEENNKYEIEDKIELWQYRDSPAGEIMITIRILFMNGYIQSISSSSVKGSDDKLSLLKDYSLSNVGKIHAETFVHPILVEKGMALPRGEGKEDKNNKLNGKLPMNVLVISKTPISIISEVIKHKHVENIDIVGYDKFALHNVTQKFMYDYIDDCSTFLFDDVTMDEKLISCLDLPIVNLIEDNVQEFLKKKVIEIERYTDASFTLTYDTVFIDIPMLSSPRSVSWSSLDFLTQLKNVLSCNNGVIVINTGPKPLTSLDSASNTTIDINFFVGGSNTIANRWRRDSFSIKDNDATKLLGYKRMRIYEEPMSRPLGTTFVVLYSSTIEEGEDFSKKPRKTLVLEDNDITQLFLEDSETKNKLPTIWYDSKKHAEYLLLAPVNNIKGNSNGQINYSSSAKIDVSDEL